MRATQRQVDVVLDDDEVGGVEKELEYPSEDNWDGIEDDPAQNRTLAEIR